MVPIKKLYELVVVFGDYGTCTSPGI